MVLRTSSRTWDGLESESGFVWSTTTLILPLTVFPWAGAGAGTGAQPRVALIQNWLTFPEPKPSTSGVPNPVPGDLPSSRVPFQPWSNTPVCNYQVLLQILISWLSCVWSGLELNSAGRYKPDSKKVGTLYKLWIKTECNDVEVSNFNILFRIQHRWHIKCLNWENVSF